ncbi:hypothetical protein KL919_005392 [Ogataea angusta]|uniref:Reverse transcriptase domain-containing protein n=1 Tax=Pichia angusta TaxID=870730 RepID=A0AAN6I2W1_PICAN|nr:uncharacterized protein KL928_005414 [Ogataea angusta]KAG7815695.1 hypothetical protein KL928_005414 [Ogataea angusta]KAG7853921.1 hypothetical protein KL919_005392 [Ogataea angusta]
MTEVIIRIMKDFLTKRGLSLNDNKTKVIDTMSESGNFTFLGVSFYRTSTKKGLKLGNTKLSIKDTIVLKEADPKKVKEFKLKIKNLIRSNLHLNLPSMISLLNPILRG